MDPILQAVAGDGAQQSRFRALAVSGIGDGRSLAAADRDQGPTPLAAAAETDGVSGGEFGRIDPRKTSPSPFGRPAVVIVLPCFGIDVKATSDAHRFQITGGTGMYRDGSRRHSEGQEKQRGQMHEQEIWWLHRFPFLRLS